MGRQCSTQQWVHTKTWQTMDTDGCASWDLIMVMEGRLLRTQTLYVDDYLKEEGLVVALDI